MKQIFQNYYRLSDNEFSELWKNCIFVLDTNVLLNLYRFPQEARDDLLRVLDRVKDRLWIPHQVALEYQENRLTVIAEQIKKFNDVKGLIQNMQKNFENELNNLQLRKRHAYINPDKLTAIVQQAFDEYLKELDKYQKKQIDLHSSDDPIRDRIETLVDSRIGAQPTAKQLEEIYTEGKARYDRKQPPGYLDANKSQNDKEENKNRDTYLHKSLVFKRIYGDLILWRELIEECKRITAQHVIFITDDEKDDWWWIINSTGKKTIGPRPELIDEICTEANVKLFYMYNSERFLEYAKKHLKVRIKTESINQVKETKQLQRLDSNLRSIAKSTLHGAQDGRCFYCNAPLEDDLVSIDHVIPVSVGGANLLWNIVLADPNCNIRKGRRIPNRQHLEKLIDLHEKIIEKGDVGSQLLIEQLGNTQVERKNYTLNFYNQIVEQYGDSFSWEGPRTLFP
jgi:5-methylcytosine-specific restriction endonuclease McrA